MSDKSNGPISLFPSINFVGRESELKQLDKWYASNVPVASILGPPGMGKTYLARKWADQKIQEGITVYYIDAGYGSLTSTDNPEENTEYILQAIGYKLGFEFSEDIAKPIELASRVRQSGSILILDQLESCLYKQRLKTNIPVGKPSHHLASFLRAFVTLGQGNGHIILVSNLRPAGIVEEQYVDPKYLTPISSDETPDPFQLGGFTLDEAIKFVRSRASEVEEMPSEDALLDAFERLGGHPKGLSFFLGLGPKDRQQFLINTPVDQPLEANLKNLFNLSIEYCSEIEKKVLVLVSLLRIPQDENFIAKALHGLDGTNLAIDDLRRRSLIEYGTINQTGYSTHGIVKEFVKATFRNRFKDTHFLIAKEFEAMAIKLPHQKSLDQLMLTVETAYNFQYAEEDQKAVFWRNKCTELALEIGKEAFLAGNYQLAKDTANALIEGDLIKTKSSPKYSSLMYFYRAQNQHQISFDWKSETQDLLEALKLNPSNKMALSFSANVVSVAIKNRIHWDQIESKLKLFIDYAQSNEIFEDQIKSIPTQSIKLLCMLGNYTPDLETRKKAWDDLVSIANQLDSITISPELLSEAEIFAILNLFDFLRQNNLDKENVLKNISRALNLSTASLVFYRSSAQLWLKHIQFLRSMGQQSIQVEERKQYLEKTIVALADMKENVSLPPGYARLLSETFIELSRLMEHGQALTRVGTIIDDLAILNRAPSAISIPQEEIDAAFIRIFMRAARLEPEKSYDYLHNAIALLQPYLHQSDKWLSIELAEQAVRIFSEIVEDDIEADYEIDLGSGRKNKLEILITKEDIKLLDAKLDRASLAAPTSKFELLKLSLRVEYLRKNWLSNDSNVPKKLIEAEKLAESILQTKVYSTRTLTIISELYRIIAKKTFSEAKFNQAVERGNEIFNLWFNMPSLNQARGLYRKAKFLRAILEYRGARKLMREYFEEEKLPHMRFYASRFFLDIVAHSINWEYLNNPKTDPLLKKDALIATSLYKEYLSYLGIEHEDIEDPNNAIRELFWIRCASFANIYKSDLSWVERAYNQLHISDKTMSGRSIHDAQIIGEWTDDNDRIAQILGSHWEQNHIWREIGTLLSILYFSKSSRLDYSTYFWRISNIISESSWADENLGHKSGQLSTLNLTRALLQYPQDSDLRKSGQTLLNAIYVAQKMPWIYWRFVKELWIAEQKEFNMQTSKKIPTRKRSTKFDIFLSHNSIDKEWAIRLKSALEKLNIKVWLDKDEIRPGDLFAKALEKGLDESRCVAIIISPEALASKWVEQEYYSALNIAHSSSRTLRLIPLLLREATLPNFLSTRNWIDFRDENIFDENVKKLVWGITGKKQKS